MSIFFSKSVIGSCVDHLQLLTDEVENEITLTAFRLLTMDLLALYSVMNEGTINVLGKWLIQHG
jgi:hypothetical protein